MSTNPNNAIVYIRDENIDKWNELGKKKSKGDFVNWALKHLFDEYFRLKPEDNNCKTDEQ